MRKPGSAWRDAGTSGVARPRATRREGAAGGSFGAAGPQPVPGRGVPPTILASLPRVLIVRTGSTAPEVQRRHGDYDRWFRDALADRDLAFDVCDATRSAIPDPSTHAGIIVTGSAKSVLKPEPWMDHLAAFLRSADQIGVPVLAVCFGCQMLARAGGGQVAPSPSGFEIGAVEVDLTEAARLDALFEGLSSPLPVLATHEDRVEIPPPGAVLLAGNACARVQAFRAGERTWGVQFHPEATAGILRELILLRRERLETEARRRGEPADRRVDHLIEGLERFDRRPSRRLLANFARLCTREGESGRPM